MAVYDLDTLNFDLVRRDKYGGSLRIKNAIRNLKPIKKDDVVFKFAETKQRAYAAPRFPDDTRIERQIGRTITGYVDNNWYTKHPWPTKPMWYMVNHSFKNPNLKLQLKDNTMQFVAIKDIPRQTVLTFKYEPTPGLFGDDSPTPERRARVNIRL